ncbi:S9 family peptidase [Kocuria sp. ZOR0020]|uniref:alpha/beta hydrolase family protein n=1 Tax=Kocuria sp. ZOR0020 TaxID=1339234 RepID=UPI00068BD55A|nr:prolyl oligopeptidase family serine peptidase [Kocuria sp. ZOR0020]
MSPRAPRTVSPPNNPSSHAFRRRDLLSGVGMAASMALVGCGSPAADGQETAESPTASSSPKPTVQPTDPPLKIQTGTRYDVAEAVMLPYGQDAARQYGELYVPQELPKNVKVPVVMLLHGGSWKNSSTLNYMRAIARNMASYGVVAWNVEYRGIGGGGGWPNTFTDVAAAMDHVPRLAQHIGREIDRKRFVLSGHSAGGHLAAWAASRHVRGSQQPGGWPVLRPSACVAFAGVYDLVYAQQSGHRQMVNLMGGTPAQVPVNYDLASPIDNIPDQVKFTCCHGTTDSVVPIAQTYNYAAMGESKGNPAETLILLDTDHLAWTKPETDAYAVGQQKLLDAVMTAGA